MSSSISQLARRINCSGVASPDWNIACSMFWLSSELSSVSRAEMRSAPSFLSVSVNILLFSLMRYLKTDSSSGIDEFWKEFLKSYKFSFSSLVQLCLMQMSIRVIYKRDNKYFKDACKWECLHLPSSSPSWRCCLCSFCFGVLGAALQWLGASCLRTQIALLASERLQGTPMWPFCCCSARWFR